MTRDLMQHNPTPQAVRAYRQAWWSLAFIPLAFVAAFIIGEGLLGLVNHDPNDIQPWQVAVASIPALVVFAAPGVIALLRGMAARRLGHARGWIPAAVGGGVAIAFTLLNLLSLLLG